MDTIQQVVARVLCFDILLTYNDVRITGKEAMEQELRALNA